MSFPPPRNVSREVPGTRAKLLFGGFFFVIIIIIIIGVCIATYPIIIQNPYLFLYTVTYDGMKPIFSELFLTVPSKVKVS